MCGTPGERIVLLLPQTSAEKTSLIVTSTESDFPNTNLNQVNLTHADMINANRVGASIDGALGLAE
jgi:uncharacterized protein YjbI with pentapeptide repeats